MNINISTRDRLIVALDVPSTDQAKQLVKKLGDSVNFYKIGLQLFTTPGCFQFIDYLKRLDKKIFIDLKLFDIPETVYLAAKNLVELEVDFITVHSTRQTVGAACRAAWGKKTDVLAVTVLTSIDHYDMETMGAVDCTLEDLVISKTVTAMKEGASGVICSGLESSTLRAQFGSDVGYIVTPGIRSSDSSSDDQRRTVTATEALLNGSDFIVVGRPIRDSEDPYKAAVAIQDEIAITIDLLVSLANLRGDSTNNS